MYILIMEDGQIYKTKHITDDDKSDCLDGLIDIIDPPNMKQYDGKTWVDIEEWAD